MPQESDKTGREILPIPDQPHRGPVPFDARDASAPQQPMLRAPNGAPNVVIVLIDDIGFGIVIKISFVERRGIERVEELMNPSERNLDVGVNMGSLADRSVGHLSLPGAARNRAAQSPQAELNRLVGESAKNWRPALTSASSLEARQNRFSTLSPIDPGDDRAPHDRGHGFSLASGDLCELITQIE